MKQMVIAEDIAQLEHRLVSTQSQATSSFVGRMLDNIDTILRNSNEIVEMSANIRYLTNEITRQQTLKKDIITQAIHTSRGMIDNLNTALQEELKKYSLKNRFLEKTAEWQKVVLDALHTRPLHMIERANFIIKHKVATLLHKNNDLQQ